MSRTHQLCTFVLSLGAGILFTIGARADLWRTGYFPGYNSDEMSASNIDFSVVTHAVHFSVWPNSNGSLNTDSNDITEANSAEIVTAAHAANRQVLICIGGDGSTFEDVTGNSTALATFVSNMTNFVAVHGYDGIDVDWEPFLDSDPPAYSNLVTRLRTALNGFHPHKLLTTGMPVPSPWNESMLPATLASLSSQFDQINLQTYDLSGPYPGWLTWHNSPIYDGGNTLPGDLTVPAVDNIVTRFITNGVPAAKIGLGVTFHGQLWTAESYPLEPLNSGASMTPITYNDIIAGYSNRPYAWDGVAQAPYIAISNASPSGQVFISYDDARACEGKVSYARNHGLGGMIIWELKQDHQAGQVDPLLNALKQALATPGTITAKRSGQNLTLGFSGAPLGSYRVQWKSNLTDAAWTTLATTNVTNSGIVPIQITDSAAFGRTRRFYRIVTP